MIDDSRTLFILAFTRVEDFPVFLLPSHFSFLVAKVPGRNRITREARSILFSFFTSSPLRLVTLYQITACSYAHTNGVKLAPAWLPETRPLTLPRFSHTEFNHYAGGAAAAKSLVNNMAYHNLIQKRFLEGHLNMSVDQHDNAT